jgi:two-component system NtrC family sensor kinase
VAQPIDVNRVVADTVELVETQGRFGAMAVSVRLAPQPLMVSGDPYQLQQVLVNLFVNAADALADTAAPELTVTALRRVARTVPEHRPARRANDPPGTDWSHRRRLAATPRYPAEDPETESGDVVEVIVVDNGPGLPHELIDQVFEPFVTTKEPGKGTGLGLAVCARVIEAMGGTIHADNADTGGAMFRLILPALEAQAVMT